LSIQDDVNYIKKELSGDEKVLESAFKIEGIYKKHKLKLGIALIAFVVFFAGKSIEQNMHESALLEANKAFLTLQKTPNDSEALKVLQNNNPALFELFTYKEAVQKKDIKALEALYSSKNIVISDASAYQASVIDKKPKDSVLYNDMALFTQGYVALESGDTKQAMLKLEQIDERSALATITGLLKHSTLKAN
jgi:hypothetical protein